MRNLIENIELPLGAEAYDATVLNCYAFMRGTDVRGGLSLALGNMVRGYGFDLQGVHFNNSECAYIAGLFSDDTPTHRTIQRALVACDNGFAAKKCIRRPHQDEGRADWETFNVQWMLYCVWQKCLGNTDFRRLLLSLPSDAVIIEDSTFQTGRTATVWGTRNMELKRRLGLLKRELRAKGMSKAAIRRELDRMRLGEWATVGCFEGQNLMGKILMACRRALESGSEPCIDYELLASKHINILSRELVFNQHIEAA